MAMTQTPVQAQVPERMVVSGVSFDADHFASENSGRYGVIVLTGSDLVPETLKLISLEYFDAPKKWLMERSHTRDDGCIIYGLSKGAELALVLASYDSDYKAVVALVPSHVVWQGNPKNFSNPGS